MKINWKTLLQAMIVPVIITIILYPIHFSLIPAMTHESPELGGATVGLGNSYDDPMVNLLILVSTIMAVVMFCFLTFIAYIAISQYKRKKKK